MHSSDSPVSPKSPKALTVYLFSPSTGILSVNIHSVEVPILTPLRKISYPVITYESASGYTSTPSIIHQYANPPLLSSYALKATFILSEIYGIKSTVIFSYLFTTVP